MKCFYHGDSDGKCAGFWVAQSDLVRSIKDKYHEYIEIDYRVKFPIETIEKDEWVFIVDYSIQPEEMRDLLKITKNVIWIDHHKTAIDKYEGFEEEIKGIRKVGISGAMLAFCYLNYIINIPNENVFIDNIEDGEFNEQVCNLAPCFTKLINDWDVWIHAYGDKTRFFQLGFNMLNFGPLSSEWNKFIDNGPGEYEEELIEKGKLLYEYRYNWSKIYTKFGFEVEFEGYKCFVMNLGLANSEYFKSLPEDKYDIFVAFVFDGTQYVHSLYSTKVDVSVIAKKYGGGGHTGAAGFQTKELLFKK